MPLRNDRDWYLAFMGLAPKRIPHMEHWSCPDAETYLTGIDYYEHPKLCRQKMAELYPDDYWICDKCGTFHTRAYQYCTHCFKEALCTAMGER